MEGINGIKNILITHIFSPEGIATLLLIFAMYLKLHVNNKATSIDYKKMLISIPGEVVFLVLGIHVSAYISGKTEGFKFMGWTLILLLALTFEYVSERKCQDQISGDFIRSSWKKIILMIFVALFCYCIIVFGGDISA